MNPNVAGADAIVGEYLICKFANATLIINIMNDTPHLAIRSGVHSILPMSRGREE